LRFSSLLLLLCTVLASSDQASPQQASLLQSNRGHHRHGRKRRGSKRCKEKIKATVTDANATGPVYDGSTSIVCTDVTEDQIPSNTDLNDYFYLKVGWKYVKVLYTDADPWGGNYKWSADPGATVTATTPDAEGKVELTIVTVSPPPTTNIKHTQTLTSCTHP